MAFAGRLVRPVQFAHISEAALCVGPCGWSADHLVFASAFSRCSDQSVRSVASVAGVCVRTAHSLAAAAATPQRWSYRASLQHATLPAAQHSRASPAGARRVQSAAASAATQPQQQEASSGPLTQSASAYAVPALRPVMACVPEHVVPGEAALNTLAQLRACEALGLSCASSANPPRDGAEPHTNPEQIPRYLLVCGYPAAPTPPQQERTVVHVFEIRQWDMRGGTHSPAQDALAALLSEPAPKKVRNASRFASSLFVPSMQCSGASVRILQRQRLTLPSVADRPRL